MVLVPVGERVGGTEVFEGRHLLGVQGLDVLLGLRRGQ